MIKNMYKKLLLLLALLTGVSSYAMGELGLSSEFMPESDLMGNQDGIAFDAGVSLDGDWGESVFLQALEDGAREGALFSQELEQELRQPMDQASPASKECHKSFDKSSQLKRHLQQMGHSNDSAMPGDERSYICEECGECFRLKKDLEAHLLEHWNEKLFKCTQESCGKAFVLYSDLSEHSLTHTRERQQKAFKCEYCTDSFKQKVNLDRHVSAKHPEECSAQLDMTQEQGVSENGGEQEDEAVASSNGNEEEAVAEYGQAILDASVSGAGYTCTKDGCGKSFGRRADLNKHIKTHSEAKPFKCDVCEKSFRHSSRLNEHKRTHTGEKPYVCEECGGAFSQSGNLNRHKLVHLKWKTKGDHECEMCDSSFPSIYELEEHRQLHTGERSFECDQCSSTFPQSSTLSRHKREEHGEGRKDQTLDSQVVAQEGGEQLLMSAQPDDLEKPDFLAEYSRLGTDRGPVLLSQQPAEGVALGKRSRDGHETVTQKKKIKTLDKCPYCDRYFWLPSDRDKHIRVHTKEKPYVCEECCRAFSRSDNLNRHKLVHLKRKTKGDHECEMCDSSFPSIYELEEHRQLHTGERSFECDQCSSTFPQSSTLSRHKREEHGEGRKDQTLDSQVVAQEGGEQLLMSAQPDDLEKPDFLAEYSRLGTDRGPVLLSQQPAEGVALGKRSRDGHETVTQKKKIKTLDKCPDCDQYFWSPSDRDKHIRVHTKEKPYSCNQCGQSFTTGPNLNRHMRVHTGEKPYSCDECSKSFADQSDFKVHMRIHTGERPYQCEICGKAFNSSSNLNRHKRKVHDQKEKAQIEHSSVHPQEGYEQLLVSEHTQYQEGAAGIGFLDDLEFSS